MKKYLITIMTGGLLFSACQQPTQQHTAAVNQDAKKLADEVIAVHDEIMPQIAVFDKTTVKIDSILSDLNSYAKKNPTADTAQVRSDLSTLKNNLESATDQMMTWMKEYDLENLDPDYLNAEMVKIKAMKKQFEDVALESNKKLTSF